MNRDPIIHPHQLPQHSHQIQGIGTTTDAAGGTGLKSNKAMPVRTAKKERMTLPIMLFTKQQNKVTNKEDVFGTRWGQGTNDGSCQQTPKILITTLATT